MIHAIKGIPSLAMALESRGFGRENRRGSFRELPRISQILIQLPLFLAAALILVGLAFL
jgi:energy-coupling factor transporter transmembrane protein EcfT